ncbi:MAG TPA: hypothetical protein VD998_01700 [Verrucomicrobiae bacterium]|nr:hypothetical protein [Verrucomicrobiae bacterium]
MEIVNDPVPVEHDKPHQKRLLVLVLGFIVLLAALYSLIPNLLVMVKGEDITGVADEDLKPNDKLIIPVAENAFYPLSRIVINGLTPINPDLQKYITDWDDGMVEKLWNEYRENYEFYDDATKLNSYQRVGANDSINGIRSIARLSAIRAIYLAKHDNIQGAYEEAKKTIKLGYVLQNSNSDLLTFLVGNAVSGYGLNAYKWIKTNYKENEDNADELRQYSDVHNGIKNALRQEYLVGIQSIREVLSGTYDDRSFTEKIKIKKNNYYFKPNLTQSYLADFYRKEVSLVGVCPAPESEIIKFNTPGYVLYFEENALGKILFDSLILDYQSARQKACDHQQKMAELSE